MLPDLSEFSTDISQTEIIYIKNFLTPEQCAHLVDSIEKILASPEENSEFIGYMNDGNTNSKSAPYIFLSSYQGTNEIIRGLVKKSIEMYEKLYGVDPDRTYIDLGTINMMSDGIGMAVHADNPPSLAKGIDTPHGMVFYLNDDYEGGEIYYPDLRLIIKPEAGSLVIHPGTVEYSHGVAPVTSGVRYATTAFSKKKLPLNLR